jgi:hypothetical protein
MLSWFVNRCLALRPAVALFLALILAAATPALARKEDCGVPPSSYAVMVTPRAHARASVIMALPQTPCAVIPNGFENAIGPIGIEITPRSQQNQPTDQPGGGP